MWQFAVTLNRFPSRSQNVSKLSQLQKRILEEGLKADWRGQIRRAWGSREPASFDISEILKDFFRADKEDVKRSYWLIRRGDHRERLAKPRAAISRAMSRLIKRGLLERIKPTGRGYWQLTAAGAEAAALVCTTLQKPTRTEILPNVKQAYTYRKARLTSAGQPMPIGWKEFCAACFFQPKKTKKRPGIKVDLD
jgi:DNA-binding MarR family transcriptional regulator